MKSEPFCEVICTFQTTHKPEKTALGRRQMGKQWWCRLKKRKIGLNAVSEKHTLHIFIANNVGFFVSDVPENRPYHSLKGIQLNINLHVN
jgi:hypothetical protein